LVVTVVFPPCAVVVVSPPLPPLPSGGPSVNSVLLLHAVSRTSVPKANPWMGLSKLVSPHPEYTHPSRFPSPLELSLRLRVLNR
jgi:hypothetical protein